MTTNLMPDDRRSLTNRLGALQYIIALGFAALAVGFWIFQIGQHDKFLEMAENNRLRKLPLPAARGVLLDRTGKVLVENQSTFNIAIVREQTKNISEVLRTVAAATRAFVRSSSSRTRQTRRSQPSWPAASSCRACSVSRCRPGSIPSRPSARTCSGTLAK